MFELKTTQHRELFTLFDPIICTDPNELRRTKPSPDIFLACAEKFVRSPQSSSQCLVFEDAENGVLAGLAAEMQVVFVPSLPLNAYNSDIIQRATIQLESLTKFDPVQFGLPPFDDVE